MALQLIVAGNVAEVDDINQYYDYLDILQSDSTLVKTAFGSMGSGVTSIPHGLGRVPVAVWGYYSTVDQSTADSGGSTIHGIGSAVTGTLYFRDAAIASAANAKSADATNIYLQSATATTRYYRIYYI